MRDLARLAIAAFGRRGQGSGVLGVDVQRIRRSLGLQAPSPAARSGRTRPARQPEPLTRDQIRRFEQHLRRELERAQIERTQALPPSRPLNELDRALPSGPLQDLAAVHRVVMQLKRRLATQGPRDARAPPARARRRAPHDARLAADRRRAGRAALPPAPPAPARALRALRRLHQRHVGLRVLPVACCTRCTTRSARCARSCSSSGSPRSPTSSSASAPSRPSPTRSPRTPASPTSPATRTTAASGASSSQLVEDDLHPRATVIVLGDARTNGRDPAAHLFAGVAARAGPHVLAQPRAAAVLELRRLGDRGLRALLRGLRVLDDAPARGLREGAHPSGSRLTRYVLTGAAMPFRRFGPAEDDA